jgi:hypothetical protein
VTPSVSAKLHKVYSSVTIISGESEYGSEHLRPGMMLAFVSLEMMAGDGFGAPGLRADHFECMHATWSLGMGNCWFVRLESGVKD